MSGAAGALSLAGNTPACPQCNQAMEACTLEGHYGQQVVTDLCPHCRLVWFDTYESVRLSGLGWVKLLRRMQTAMGGFTGVQKDGIACPHCQAALKPVANLTRFGRFAMLECPRRHGHLQSFSLLLAERGLVRPLGREDRRALADERRTPCCMNCGAELLAPADRCTYCDSPLVVIDMPRLMAALLVRHAEPLPAQAAERVAWACRGCGSPLEPTRSARCEACHHPVVVPSMLDLRPLLDQAEPLLRAAPRPRAGRPHGERLRQLRGDHRATAAHRYLRSFFDILGQGDPDKTALRWIVLGLVAAAVWYFF